MQLGFNENVMHKEVRYHVQTEDGGRKNPVITTLLFKEGIIISSKRTSYADIIKSDKLDVVVNEIMTKPDIENLKKWARQLRLDVLMMLNKAKSGHTGGSLSAADIVAALYFYKMRHNQKEPKWLERDRFILSKGHAAPIQYAALARCGYFPPKELLTLRRLGSILQGHPDMKRTPGIEVCTGSLGQGLSMANDMALALRLDKSSSRVYALLCDGEVEEGQVWEAAMTASHYKLDNLCAIVDF